MNFSGQVAGPTETLLWVTCTPPKRHRILVCPTRPAIDGTARPFSFFFFYYMAGAQVHMVIYTLLHMQHHTHTPTKLFLNTYRSKKNPILEINLDTHDWFFSGWGQYSKKKKRGHIPDLTNVLLKIHLHMHNIHDNRDLKDHFRNSKFHFTIHNYHIRLV